ncbi:MAG: threonine synthase [Mycobacterium sp.]
MASTMNPPPLECICCRRQFDVRELAWRCTCGGLLDVAGTWKPALAPGVDDTSLWRYQSVLPVERDASISLGEGGTPIVRSRSLPGINLKLEFLSPTLSFKDRGAVVLATLAASIGVESVLIDSSGNAGLAAAAYFGRAGIRCEVMVPASTSQTKVAQIRAYGATVTAVPGNRADTSAAAVRRADSRDIFYASHVYHPYFLHGVKTYGYEIWESNGRTLPSAVIVPVGNGTMLLGCHLAFTELVAAGLADRLPAIVAVQAQNCAPLAAAFAGDADDISPGEVDSTVAEGIAIPEPPRSKQILAAIRATGGSIVTVSDDEILSARRRLALEGLFVEPTASACFAAAMSRGSELPAEDDVVVALCGAGARG